MCHYMGREKHPNHGTAPKESEMTFYTAPCSEGGEAKLLLG